MRRWVRRVLIVLAIVLGLLVLLVLGLRWAEPRLIYFPSGPVHHTPADLGLPYQAVAISTADGQTLQAWWIPAPAARDDAAAEALPVLLFCHGNAGSREGRLPNLAGLHRAGIAVLIFDYRGYGGSTGTPSERGLTLDGEAAYDWLRREVGVLPIVVFGRSLGGAVAAQVAIRRPAAGLILESTFTSARDVARHVLPLPGIAHLMRSRFDVVAAVRRWHGPLLMIHGEADEVVPFALGQRLYAAAVTPDKAFHAVPGGHHNDTYVLAGPAYWRWLRDFLQHVQKQVVTRATR